MFCLFVFVFLLPFFFSVVRYWNYDDYTGPETRVVLSVGDLGGGSIIWSYGGWKEGRDQGIMGGNMCVYLPGVLQTSGDVHIRTGTYIIGRWLKTRAVNRRR